MKMNEYGSIKSYGQLKEFRRRNKALLRAKRGNIEKELSAMADSLSPKYLLNEIARYISPLLEISEIFKRFCGKH